MKRLMTAATGLTLGMALAACGSSSNAQSAGGAPSGNSADSMMAQQSVKSATDAGNSDTATSSYSSDRRIRLGGSFSDTTTMDGCEVDVSGDLNLDSNSFALDANFVFDSSGCINEKISGTESVSVVWSSEDANDRTLNVTANLSVTQNGNILTIAPLTQGTPNWSIDASGVTLIGNASLSIIDSEHRVATDSNGTTIFDINITSNASAPLVLATTYDDEDNVSVALSGVSVVRHNVAKFTATQTFNNLGLAADGSCSCPVSGGFTQAVTVDGGGSYTRTYTFTGCGEATVVTSSSTLKDTSNGTATVTWNDCD